MWLKLDMAQKLKNKIIIKVIKSKVFVDSFTNLDLGYLDKMFASHPSSP